jgi:hypothetical protein
MCVAPLSLPIPVPAPVPTPRRSATELSHAQDHPWRFFGSWRWGPMTGLGMGRVEAVPYSVSVDRMQSLTKLPTSNKYIKVFPRLTSFCISRFSSPYSFSIPIPIGCFPYLPRIGGPYLHLPLPLQASFLASLWLPTNLRRISSISSILSSSRSLRQSNNTRLYESNPDDTSYTIIQHVLRPPWTANGLQWHQRRAWW